MNNNNTILMVLPLVIAVSLLSLPILATMATAQPSSNSTPGSSSSNSTGNDTNVKEMGICQTGVKSPCNGNSVQ